MCAIVQTKFAVVFRLYQTPRGIRMPIGRGVYDRYVVLKGKVSYMSSFRVSPFIGAVIFNRSSWERMPADSDARTE